MLLVERLRLPQFPNLKRHGFPISRSAEVEERHAMKLTRRYEKMTPEKRPQDPSRDGTGLTFATLEHGGEYPDTMPQAIRLTDAEGRSCIYVPITQDGKVVDSEGYSFGPEDEW
jgi:hypothetical protein